MFEEIFLITVTLLMVIGFPVALIAEAVIDYRSEHGSIAEVIFTSTAFALILGFGYWLFA